MKTIKAEIKQNHFRNYKQEVAINILYTSSWLVNRQKDFFKSYGITNQQYNILSILRGQFPNKVSGTEIKARMLDKNSDVSRLLDRLILKNLISKTQCPNDKRAADIAISDEGMKLLSDIDKRIQDLDIIISSLSDKEAAQLSTLLDKVRS